MLNFYKVKPLLESLAEHKDRRKTTYCLVLSIFLFAFKFERKKMHTLLQSIHRVCFLRHSNWTLFCVGSMVVAKNNRVARTS